MKVLLTIVVLGFALVGLVAVLALFWLKFRFGKAVRERLVQADKEYQVQEPADWFGKTGLDDETERELPRYLRRELGESLFDEGSLKAADLVYLGDVVENGNRVHYWRMPYGKESAYPYVEVGPDGGTSTGWGDKEPPEALRTAQPFAERVS